MRADIRKGLEQIRRAMTEGEEAWGPESDVDTEHEKGSAGVGGAKNVSDVEDNFDAYLYGIIDEILEEYDMDEEEAIDYVFDVAAQLAEDGMLPAMPDADDAAGSAAWLGAAATVQFGQLVLAALESSSNEE